MPSVRRCRARPPSARAPRSPAPARAFPRRDRARDRERARRGERRNDAARAPAVGKALGSRPFRSRFAPRRVPPRLHPGRPYPIESPRDPMGEHAPRRIGVADQQRQRSRFFGNVCPAKRRRHFVAVAGVPARDRLRVLESAALERQRGHQQVRWSGAAVTTRSGSTITSRVCSNPSPTIRSKLYPSTLGIDHLRSESARPVPCQGRSGRNGQPAQARYPPLFQIPPYCDCAA
jgi:hypothetical protein